jgi:hypothetical protein
MMSGAQASIMARLLHSPGFDVPRAIVYRRAMPSYGPPGPGGYGPPGSGGYRPPAKPITGSPETMAMHAMTIDPKTGLPRGEQPPASTEAVVSLVCGILLCLGPFTGVPAIIAGSMARKAARQRPQAVGGVGMATAGIVLGALNLLLSAIGVAIGLYSLLQG